MISTTNLEQAKKLINKAKEKPAIVQASSNSFNRKVLEYGKFDILLSPETGKRKDRIKLLNSGLDSVMAKIATKNKIAVGIDIKSLTSLDKKEKAQTLARIRQNIAFCKKAKTKLKIINYKDKKDAFSFLLSLGASTTQAREAF